MASDRTPLRWLLAAGLFACCAIVAAAQPAVPNTPDDPCVRGEPEPQLAGSAQLRSHRFIQADALESVEEAVLRDGLVVTINQYGCAHFGLEVVFDADERRRDESTLEAARRLMQRLLRAVPDFLIGRRFLDVSASQSAEARIPIEFVETEGYSWFVVGADSGKLTVSYDVAL